MKISSLTFSRMFSPGLLSLAMLLTVAMSAGAQQPGAQQAAAHFDVTNYRIEAQLIPEQHMLRAGADITVIPLESTRSLVFELNGSLKVETIDRDGKPTTFVQDAVGVGSLGPSVRVDLGQVVPANQPLTLRFRWSGALLSPEGGPLATKRLAYVGTEGSYLMYASRWFPFHDYAADRATSDITLIVPTGVQVAGTSDEPVTPQASPKDGATRFRFVHRQPVLIGNFAAGQYINRNLRFGRLRDSVLREARQRRSYQWLRRDDGPGAGVLFEAIWRAFVRHSPGSGPGRR